MMFWPNPYHSSPGLKVLGFKLPRSCLNIVGLTNNEACPCLRLDYLMALISFSMDSISPLPGMAASPALPKSWRSVDLLALFGIILAYVYPSTLLESGSILWTASITLDVGAASLPFVLIRSSRLPGASRPWPTSLNFLSDSSSAIVSGSFSPFSL